MVEPHGGFRGLLLASSLLHHAFAAWTIRTAPAGSPRKDTGTYQVRASVRRDHGGGWPVEGAWHRRPALRDRQV